MPSNDSPAFDVLNADENDLWEWAVERAGVENAATYIRDETLKAARDTDLARARVEGAREALGKLSRAYADFKYISHLTIENFVASNYPAPKSAECRLSDGSVVTWRAEMALPQWERVFPDKTATYRPWGQWPSLLKDHDTGADFDALKAFAATITEASNG